MLLKRLEFENYKTYYGFQEVNLYIPKDVRNEGKNIILLGGLNGAGKTTILKSILYVLFGKRGMETTEYGRLFSNVINNTFFEEGGREASVTLTIETDFNETWRLKVTWYFDKLKRVTHEERNITVSKPGSKLSKQARIDNIEAYNRFIDKIIPYHAAPFFIFDGEEVKDIILRQNSNEMKNAIHKISGMEASKQLLQDLKTLLKKLEKQLAESASISQNNQIQRELEEINNSIETYTLRKNKIEKEIQKTDSLLKEAKDTRQQKLINNSKSRETIIKKQSRMEYELTQLKSENNKLFNDNVINIILNNKIRQLKDTLKEEHRINNEQVLLNNRFVPYYNFIDKLLEEDINPSLTNDQVKQLRTSGEVVWAKLNDIYNCLGNSQSLKIIHDISPNDYNLIINYPITERSILINRQNKVDQLENDVSELEYQIRSAPDTVHIDEENGQIDSLTKILGELNFKLNTVTKRVKKLEEQKINITNKLTRSVSKNSSTEDLQKQYALLSKLVPSIEKYIEQVTELKASMIRDEFSYMLNKLFRKQKEFGKIEFDMETYTIRLYSDRMQEISIQDRSAGEMQMISSALVWALIKSSVLSLPIVVDTPLGRLDSYHRKHLIEHYYKELSEQVIILSTDTEITQEYVDLMKANSYKQYVLDYDQEKKYTVIKDGYFNF